MTDTELRATVRSPRALSEAMRWRGFTNRGLAARTGVHHSAISHLRTGYRHRVTMTLALRIAEALDMPVEHLFVPELANGSEATRPEATRRAS